MKICVGAGIPRGHKNRTQIDAKTDRKSIKNDWKIKSESMLIFEQHFSGILESTCLHFWSQVETQKRIAHQNSVQEVYKGSKSVPRGLKSVPRGLKSLPKVTPEGSEEAKISPRTSKTWPPQFQERPKIAQSAKTKVAPYKIIGKL